MSRSSESTELTVAFGNFISDVVKDVAIKGNTIKALFGDFGLINLRVTLPGINSRTGKTVSYEICFEAIKNYIIETGDICASGYDTYRKANEKDWPTSATIKRSNDGTWIAAKVLRELIAVVK